MADRDDQPTEAPGHQPQPQSYDANKRWYDEYHATFHRLCQADAENIKLIQRIHVLERDAQSQALTESAIYSLGSTDLLRFGREHAALVRAIVEELRVRHIELPDELRGL
jgi:tRNA(Leu) C34 or U34 (ribose-2'-O)-methylase TrmL